MTHLYRITAAIFLMSASYFASAKPAEVSSSAGVVCKAQTPSGTSASIVEALTRMTAKVEALAGVRVEQQARGDEIYFLMRIDVLGVRMLGSTYALSHAADPKASVGSFNDLARDAKLASMGIDGLIKGNAALGLERVKDETALDVLRDVHCEMEMLDANVREWGKKLYQ